MLTSTFGVIMIVLGGLVALAAMEGLVMYAAVRPTWKTGRGASREGLFEPQELDASPDTDQEIDTRARAPVGAGHG